MPDKKVSDLINAQVGKEFYSAYLYLDFANYFADRGLEGFAHWYEVQAQEERDHALMMRTYLIDNGVAVRFGSIDAPEGGYKSDLAVLEAGLKHERYVTDLISAIYAAAHESRDYRTMQFLDWFVKEQGEEEKNADDLIKKMKLFGGDSKGLYMLDRELAARVYTPPATTA